MKINDSTIQINQVEIEEDKLIKYKSLSSIISDSTGKET